MIKDFIIEKIEEYLKTNCEDMNDTIDLREVGLTSLNVIEIITALEEEFNFEIKEEDLNIEKLSSISAYEDIILKYTKIDDMEISRKDAWNLVGGNFWRQGRESARPNDKDIKSFISGLEKGSNIAVIGASTKYLIEYAISTQLNVTVLDFSETMLKDLEEEIGNKCNYILCDILQGVPPKLKNKFDCIVSDRLINRFTKEESINVVLNTLQLINETGVVKHAIKLGLYKMDKKLIQYGTEHNILDNFYNKQTKTINYVKTKAFLNDCIVAHGNIPKDILFKWYLGRGKESRYDLEDIIDIVKNAGGAIESIENYDSNKETKVFVLKNSR